MEAFFWTPCGHGAEVIIEGREVQLDGGAKDKDNPTTKNNSQLQPKGRVSTILWSFLCARVKQVKRTIDGPEFTKEEHGSEGLCSSKVSKKSSNGLHCHQ